MADDENRHSERVRSRDIPRLLNALACEDSKAQAETLTLLCPCRNVRYDKEVWEAIFRTAACSRNRDVQDRAAHAIGTLRERARTDPRSQDLLRWLIERQVAPPTMEDAIPVWRPFPMVNGLVIPRYEPPRRSEVNRRKRK